MIIRGTTPLLTFTVNNPDIDFNAIEECWVTIRIVPKGQNKKDRTYYKEQMEFDAEHRTIMLRLTQEDTLQLTASPCQVQMRLKLTNGIAYASEIFEETVEKILNSGVI